MSDYDALAAFKQRCSSPLNKLVLIGICEWRPRDQGNGDNDDVQPFLVDREDLEEFCCCSRESVTRAVVDLAKDGHFVFAGYSSTHFSIQFPSTQNAEWGDPESLGVPYSPELVRAGVAQGEAYVPRPPWTTSGHRQRARLWEAQRGKCWYCACELAVHEEHWEPRPSGGGLYNGWQPIEGFSGPVIEHQTPKSRGGPNRRQNKVLSCGLCNSRKSDRRIEEFRDWCALNGWDEPVVFFGETLATTSVAGDEP
jgi:hypothetical protein